MKRTWNNFRDKKPYKKVQDITGAALHKRFCLNGDNLCGGPFEHTREPSDLVAGVIEATTLQSQPEVAIKQEKTTATGGSSSKAPRGKMVKATAQSVNNSQPASESMFVDLDDIENPPQERDTSVQSKNVVKLTIRRSTSRKVGSSLPRPSILGSDEEESHSEQVASLFESKEASKKTTKSRKASQKGKRATRKGKKKATSFPVESEDERDETSRHSPDIQSNAKAEEIHAGKRRGARRIIHSDEEEDDALEITSNESGNTPALFPDAIESYEEAPVSQPHEVSDIEMSQDSPDELDDTILPPGLENWENWNKVAFESGNSKIFLKLGAWMLLRFRQLAVLPVDADVNGLVIPQSPRGMSFDNEDDFYEALGMERLYSAVAHIDTRPRYMRHLLHSLGRSVASADSEIGKTHDLAASSPPAVTLSMMSDMTLPWISLANDMHDEIPVDDAEEQGKVIHAMEDMAIDSDGVPVDDTVPDMSRPEFKRKRTSSHASPPKKDGGRGPSKRPKEAIAVRSISTPPVITSTVLGPSTVVAPPIILVPATQDPQGANFESVNNGNSNIYDDDADAVGDLVEDEESFPSPPDPPSVAESGAAVESSSITADSDIIRFLAQFPPSLPSSKHVLHLPASALAEDDITDVVETALRSNIPVVLSGVAHDGLDCDPSAKYLDKRFAISPKRPVCIHGESFFQI
ncbi:hypothetical protein BDR06DRAFT_1015501 [Suillus hirtellus]|nr:hypothetical protein BDR06DRAFT_1015501 [Suillus hirtellus]